MIKQLIGTFGGGLYIWDIIHPHRIVSQYKSDVQLPLNKKLNKNDATAYDINEMIPPSVGIPPLAAQEQPDFKNAVYAVTEAFRRVSEN